MTRLWLCGNEDFDPTDAVLFGEGGDFNGDVFGDRSFTMPVTSLSGTTSTGGSGRTAQPGLFHDPRVRTFSDKLATPTTSADMRPITFLARLEAQPPYTFDQIKRNWAKVEDLLDRAEQAASPFSRGTGVTLIEFLEDSEVYTIWDVVSGLASDIDPNTPGSNMYGMVVQLVVLPFGRGLPVVTPFGSTQNNGAALYVTGTEGDADALFEIRLKDVSLGGFNIGRVRVARRSYRSLLSTDFTPFYSLAGTVNLSGAYQTLATQTLNTGKHQTGLLAALAVLNDASPVIGQPGIVATQKNGTGLLSSGLWQYVFVGQDTNGRWGPPSGLISLPVANAISSGGLQVPMNILDYDGAESQQWLGWDGPPSAGSVAGSFVQIDNTSPLDGQYSFHFKAKGQTNASITAISTARKTLVKLPSSNIKSTRLLFKADSFAADTVVSTPSPPTVVEGAAASGGATGWPAGTYEMVTSYTFPQGETVNSTGGNVTVTTSGDYIDWTPPALPSGVLQVNLYFYSTTVNLNPITAGFFLVSSYASGSTPIHTSKPTITSESPHTFGGVKMSTAPRFRWGSYVNGTAVFQEVGGGGVVTVNTPVTLFNGIELWGTSTPGVFSVQSSFGQSIDVGYTPAGGPEIGSVTLLPGMPYLIEFNYDNSATNPRQRLYISELGGSPPNTILEAGISGTALVEPQFLEIRAVSMGQTPAVDEEFRIDDITTADQFIGGIAGIGGGENDFAITPGQNGANTWAFWQQTPNATGSTTPTTGNWFGLNLGGVTSWSHTNPFPDGAEFAEPPLGALAVNNAIVRAEVGAGTAPIRFQPRPPVRTTYANGIDELVNLGLLSLGGNRQDYQSLGQSTVKLQVLSGGTNTDAITAKGLLLVPVDDVRAWQGITAEFGDLAQQCEIRIGTNRWGRSYCLLLDKATETLLAFGEVSGRISLGKGDSIVSVFFERMDTNGRWIADLTNLKAQVSYRRVPRANWAITRGVVA